MVPLFRRAMSKKRILMLVAPRDFYEPEYFAPRKLFDDEGFEICVASGDKHAFGAQGTEIVTWPVADQDQADYAALFVAGGKGMIDFSEDAAAKKLLRKFLRAGKPVALVCHGPLLAAKAKAVAGKEVTGWPDIRKDMEKAGAKWTGMPIERDGLLFTAVGPDDAEDLAYALASAVKGDKMLARSEAARLLGTRDAFRKLAVIHRMAAAAEEDDEEEFLRQLLQHEEEFGIEPEEEAFPEQAEPQKEPPAGFPEEKPGEPRPPAQPVPAAAPPAVVPPKPGPSTVVRFAPPRTDGQWQEVPSAPPAGFPFPAEAFQNTESLTALFRDPASWEAVRAAAAHPLKKAALQAYLVPAIVLLIGKEWWKNQKYGRSDNLKGAPFGVFDKDLLKQHRGQNINETVLGRSAIAQINMEVADLIGFAVSKLNSGYDISAYLYRSLHNRMVMFAGKNQGYELHKQAACAYCRWKLNMPSRVPKLELVENYDMRGKGLGSGFSRRMIYKCPRCEDMIGNLGLQIEALTQSISDDQETLSFLKTKIELHPGDDRARSAAEEMRARIAASQDSLQNARRDIEARKRLARVPYQHIVCINPDCKGVRIPLTFIDWTDESWQAGPQGERRVRMIADVFGIRKPGHEAEADDAPAAAGGSGEPDVPEQPFGARKPPSWLQRVPFVCPYDGSRFTPEQAFGKGYISRVSGRPLGGLIVDAVRTNLWRLPASAPGRVEPEKAMRVDRRDESDNAEIMFYRSIAPSIRMELLRKKNEYLSSRTQGKSGVSRRRMEDLYDAVLEWSLDNPEDLMGYFVGRASTEYTRNKRDSQGYIRLHKSMGRWHKERMGYVIAAIWQAWFAKMLERYNGDIGRLMDPKKGAGISKWFTSTEADNMPPEACFIGEVERLGAAESSKLIIRCPLHYGDDTPLGPLRRGGGEGRRSSYGKKPSIAVLRGLWKYPGKPPSADAMRGPIAVERAASLMEGTNMLKDVARYDFSSIILDAAMTDLNPGDHALCRALFMPTHRAWYPFKNIMWLRKDFDEDNDFMETIGRIADGSEEDASVFEEWTAMHETLGMPALLEDLDRRIMERRKKR